MADQNEIELFTVDIDEEAAIKALIELRKQSIELRNEKDALRKANRDGKLDNEEYAKSLTKAQVSLNATTKEIAVQERALSNNTKQQQAAAGSITQMRAQVSLLYADYVNLSKAERENAEVGGVMKKQLADLNAELKDQEGQTGDNRRSIGGYAEAIEKAIAGNSALSGGIGGTIASLKEAKNNLTDYIKGLKSTTEGMGGAQKASFALGLGLKAIGIGLLLQAIAAVVAFLTKMDAGMDKVEQATAAVSAAFEAFIQTIAPLGEIIVGIFEHPLDSIAAFGEALAHPIDTFIKLKDKAADFSENVGQNMAKAARAAVEYTKAMQDSEDAQDGLISQQAKVNQMVSIALLATKDRSKSERERIALLDKAGDAERKLSKEIVKIKTDELNALIKFQASKKELQDADRKQLQEATAAATNAQTENLETEQKIQNRRSALIESEAAERKAAAEKAKQARKDAAEGRVADAERQLIEAKESGKDTLSIEEDIIHKRLAADKIGLEKNKSQRLLLTAKANADIIKAESDHAQALAAKAFDLQSTVTNTRLTLAVKGSQQELDLQKKQLEERLVLDRANANATIKDKKLLKLKLLELDATFGVANEQLEDNFNKAQIDRAADQNQKRLDTERDLSKQSFAELLDFQRRQVDQEEKHALELLDLEEKNAKERALLDEKLANDLLVRRNAIQAKAIAQRRELDQQAIEREKAAAVALAEARLAATAEGSRKELEAQKDLLKKRLAQELANTKLTEEEKAKIKAQYKKEEEKLDTAFSEKTVNQIIDTVSNAASTLSTIFDAQSQALLKHLDVQQAAALKSAGANADLRARIEEQYQGKREKLEKDAAKKRQKIASIENLIATAQAGTAALTLFAKNPILGAITEALILTKALASQALIDSQTFARGGVAELYSQYTSDGRGAYVRGPGSGTSDSIRARLSNGESVLTAKATQMYYNELSAMNVRGGGRAFPGADGGISMPAGNDFAYGGIPQSAPPDFNDFVSALAELNIFVRVTDIDEVKGDMVKAQAMGEI